MTNIRDDINVMLMLHHKAKILRPETSTLLQHVELFRRYLCSSLLSYIILSYTQALSVVLCI